MESFTSSKTQSWLSWFYRGMLLLGLLILLGRLIDLQVIRGKYFRKLSEGNRIRRVLIKAPRGDIVARGGELLAGNREKKRAIVFNPEEGYQKTDIISGVDVDEIIIEYERIYGLSDSSAHITGYLGNVNESELGKINPDCLLKGPYGFSSQVGRTGLEEGYECLLAGVDGEKLVEVDSSGRLVRTLGIKKPVKGSDLRTSIHYGLQKKVSEIMQEGRDVQDTRENRLPNAKGAVVVTDLKGNVLALYSSPSFDPNVFTSTNSVEIQKVFANKSLPLFNRVIGGSFHPGSIFKPLVLVSALEDGAIDSTYTYTDTGKISIDTLYGSFSYSNWYYTQYGGTEGEIDLQRALARSTDTFFYKVGELEGIDGMVEWSEKFGLGKLTNIDIPGETPGLIPSPKWKKETKGENWFLGNTYHFSIGQSDILVTPIQINSVISAIASEGSLCKPTIVDVGDGEYECNDISLNKSTIISVIEGMVEACTSGGTGYTFFDVNSNEENSIKVACKTGTAENAGDKDPHSWFTFFAPVDFPEIVVTVLFEEGGEGSRVAGSVAREIYDYWFNQND